MMTMSTMTTTTTMAATLTDDGEMTIMIIISLIVELIRISIDRY